jgi:hypothetical protein
LVAEGPGGEVERASWLRRRSSVRRTLQGMSGLLVFMTGLWLCVFGLVPLGIFVMIAGVVRMMKEAHSS